jgi:hypothetical protein
MMIMSSDLNGLGAGDSVVDRFSGFVRRDCSAKLTKPGDVGQLHAQVGRTQLGVSNVGVIVRKDDHGSWRTTVDRTMDDDMGWS